MRLRRRNIAPVLAAAALLAAFNQAAVSAQEHEFLALVGGTIYVSPTELPIRNGTVLIRSGKIAAVGTRPLVSVPHGAQRLDCSGLFITPGFWNSHIHFFERKWANAVDLPAPEAGRQLRDMLLRYGFTSVFDLSSMYDNTRRLRDRIESREVMGPRIRTTGEALVPPGALPPEQILSFMGLMRTPLPEVADPPQAAAIVRRLVQAGVDGIKLIASSPRSASLSADIVRAVVQEAHGSGKPVFVHPNTRADLLTALHGGADMITHTTPSGGDWDSAMISAMREARVALIPTLKLWKYQSRHDRISAQEQFVNTAIRQLRAWAGIGGKVLFGTDAGAVDYHPGDEFALMAEAGMSFREILASLTTAPAERFGEANQSGRIAVGLRADLVVLAQDPSTDVQALAAVRYTIRDGEVLYQAEE